MQADNRATSPYTALMQESSDDERRLRAVLHVLQQVPQQDREKTNGSDLVSSRFTITMFSTRPPSRPPGWGPRQQNRRVEALVLRGRRRRSSEAAASAI